MSIKKTNDGWIVRLYPDGKGGRDIRRKAATKAEALRIERDLIAKIENDESIGTKKDNTRLLVLIKRWFDAKGFLLTDSKARLMKLNNLANGLGNPIARLLKTEDLTDYRQKRLSGKAAVKPATVKREFDYLRAVFNQQIKSGQFNGSNPVLGVEYEKQQRSAVRFLTIPEQKKLLKACEESESRHLLIIVLICLSTGTRWSEAEKLEPGQVYDCRIMLNRTKGKKPRTLRISKTLYALIKAHTPQSKERLFCGTYDAFEAAIARSGIVLPDGQMTHVLRHTFAVYFMKNGGDILTLKDVLGHSSIQTTMVYLEHGASHLEKMAELNPVVSNDLLKQV